MSLKISESASVQMPMKTVASLSSVAMGCVCIHRMGQLGSIT